MQAKVISQCTIGQASLALVFFGLLTCVGGDGVRAETVGRDEWDGARPGHTMWGADDVDSSWDQDESSRGVKLAVSQEQVKKAFGIQDGSLLR